MKAAKAIGEWNEQDLLGHVRELADAMGWHYYHTHDSRRSPEGYPDVVMVRDDRQVVAELKVRKRKPTAAQNMWLDAYRQVGAEVYLWTEDDLQEIADTLAGKVL